MGMLRCICPALVHVTRECKLVIKPLQVLVREAPYLRIKLIFMLLPPLEAPILAAVCDILDDNYRIEQLITILLRELPKLYVQCPVK